MECLAEDLAFPEGPVVMADGSVIVVELLGGRVTRCWNGRTETVCETGGGPNGAAIGPDGALWICNNGGLLPGTERGPGRIERIDLATGRFERVYDSCDGVHLCGPNDLVFDDAGQLWFTDNGSDHEHHRMIGGLFAARADGSQITAINRRAISYNGIGLSPDQSHVYVADTSQARLYRYDNCVEAQQPHYIATGIGPSGFDSLAVTHGGNICIANVFGGGITTVTPDGQVSVLPIPEEYYVTNIAFGGEDMRDAYITLSGSGKLVRMRWEEPGLRLAFNG
ncbi:SMP-30/gluconolactonase/LRE family protein [Sphingobium sp. AP49]|uniref:SMP-30/gluconolactonase/LRE family protein n=1 Tax=Sphingobium sp. AP49 TaxID=1144307 RepID=UPI00026ED6D3|nr:SMP-30/gluconolactonase/LRE family protein [Sphingobium sp. AP49]WHO37236.1 SMP-30/gluconolactonase/LRE family protein [Sphingobium sp. AP49]